MRADLKDGVLNLVFDSAKTNNAFGLPEAKILSQSLKGKIRLIVLSAEGRVFCSGGNLRDYAQLKNKASGIKMNKDIRGALEKLAKFPAPKVALVTGDCFGGGIEVLSCFDFILCEPHVVFGMWQRKMELSFGWGGYGRLKARVNPSHLKSWLLAGSLRTAQDAKNLGLVGAIVPAGLMKMRFEGLKKSLLAFSDESYAEIKSHLDKNETLVFEKLWWSKNHRECLEKFSR
jgi:enoyl-CoA hydratase/carnithine racemase